MFLLAQAYTSILYLKKFDNFRIILRGKPVEQIRITDELKFKKVVTYKPHAAHDSQVVINIFCNSNPCYLVSYLYHFSPTSNCARQFGCMSGSKVRKQSLSSFSFFFWSWNGYFSSLKLNFFCLYACLLCFNCNCRSQWKLMLALQRRPLFWAFLGWMSTTKIVL